MPINITMPALSPTMEEGNLAKWLVKEGDKVSPGDVIAEIETDKATMEVEAVDEGTVAKLLVPAGTEGVKVNAVIAILLRKARMQAPPPRAATLRLPKRRLPRQTRKPRHPKRKLRRPRLPLCLLRRNHRATAPRRWLPANAPLPLRWRAASPRMPASMSLPSPVQVRMGAW